jgi:hypothetical protein
MNIAVDLLARCRDASVELGVVGSSIVWEADADPPSGLLAELTMHKADVLALLRGPFGNCDQCGRHLDERRRCWRCCDRPCLQCGRPTGSAFIATCCACGNACNGNSGEPL